MLDTPSAAEAETLTITRRYEPGDPDPTYWAEKFPEAITIAPELIGTENADGNPMSFIVRMVVRCANGIATYEYTTGNWAEPYGSIEMKRVRLKVIP